MAGDYHFTPEHEEELEKSKNEKVSIPFFIPYALFIKHLAEKTGLGDAEDFYNRVNKINKFVDNAEISHNVQLLGSKAKAESIKNGNLAYLPKGQTKEEGIKFWNEMADEFKDNLNHLGLNEMNEKELIDAMKNKGFTPSTNREGAKNLLNGYNDSINNFSKKGQKVPFKDFPTETPRAGVARATKKYNLLSNTLDVLSNPKLNAALSIFLTPTPIYEENIEDKKKKAGIPTESLNSRKDQETEQP